MGVKFTLFSDDFYMDTLIDSIKITLKVLRDCTVTSVCVSQFICVVEYNKLQLFCEYTNKDLRQKVKFSSVLKCLKWRKDGCPCIEKKNPCTKYMS